VVRFVISWQAGEVTLISAAIGFTTGFALGVRR